MTAELSVVEVTGPPAEAELARVGDLLRTLPGVGAVVVLGSDGAPVCAVTYEHLASKAGKPGLAGLLQVLRAKSYDVVDAEARPWDEPPVARRPVRVLAHRVLNVTRLPLHRRVANGRRRWRRRRFLTRIRWEGWVNGTSLTLRVAKDLYVEPGIRFHMAPGRALLEIGPRCRLQSGTLLRLRGDLIMGPGCEIRQDVSINVKGELRLTGRNVIGKGAMLHADAPMLWEWGASVAEYVTVLDTHHELDGSLVHILDQGVEGQAITLGAASFVGAKASIMPGVRVGRGSVVGAGSVATRDVPDGAVVTGIPATVRRQR